MSLEERVFGFIEKILGRLQAPRWAFVNGVRILYVPCDGSLWYSWLPMNGAATRTAGTPVPDSIPRDAHYAGFLLSKGITDVHKYTLIEGE